VNVNKSVTLQGNKIGLDARTRTTANETIVNGNAGTTSFNVTANNVTIDGFTVQGQTDTSQGGAGIVLASGTSGSQVRNNIAQNNVAGLFLANNSAANRTVIEQNLFKNNNNPGSSSGAGIYTDQSVAGSSVTNVLINANSFVGNTTDGGIDFSSASNGS